MKIFILNFEKCAKLSFFELVPATTDRWRRPPWKHKLARISFLRTDSFNLHFLLYFYISTTIRISIIISFLTRWHWCKIRLPSINFVQESHIKRIQFPLHSSLQLGTRTAIDAYLAPPGRRDNEVSSDIVIPQVLIPGTSVAGFHFVFALQTGQRCFCDMYAPTR